MFSIHSELSSLRRDSWSFNLFRAQGKYQIVIVIPFEIKHSQFFFAIFVIFYFFFALLTPFSLGKSESPCRPSECELQLFFSTEKGLKFQCCRQEIQFFYNHYLFWHVQILLMSFSFRCHTTPSLGASVYSETCSGWFRRDISSQISKF